MGFFNLKSSQMSWLSLSGSFKYVCYGSATTLYILIVSVPGTYYTPESAVYRRHIVTYKDGPPAKRLTTRVYNSQKHISK